MQKPFGSKLKESRQKQETTEGNEKTKGLNEIHFRNTHTHNISKQHHHTQAAPQAPTRLSVGLLLHRRTHTHRSTSTFANIPKQQQQTQLEPQLLQLEQHKQQNLYRSHLGMAMDPHQMVDGRLYLRCVPLDMSWWDVAQWCEHITGSWPAWVGLLKPGMDMRSCYLHFKKTPADLEWMAEVLSGHWLTHKPTLCTTALDVRPSQRPRLAEVSRLKRP